MAQVAQVYARALFEAASESRTLDAVKEQLAQFDDALRTNWEFQLFFFSPNFSTAEKIDGVKRAVSDADPSFVNFLELLIDKHRMPELSRIRERFEQLWDTEMKVLPVEEIGRAHV